MLRVADFPRPPALERETRRVRIVFAGETVADTTEAWRVMETYHPPSYYLPMHAFPAGALVQSGRGSFCEWKGMASYWSLTAGGRTAPDVAWGYLAPSPGFTPIAGHVALYAGPMDGCFVGDERVTPQPGGFYGGWITSELEGPFKGGPGTQFW